MNHEHESPRVNDLESNDETRTTMEKMPQKSLSDRINGPDAHDGNQSVGPGDSTIALPSHVAGSGTLDRLVETARDYARQAASDNTLKAYAKDWAHFARWCRMRGADPLPSSPQLIGLYIADLAAPSGKAPALSVSSIERRLSGLTWGYAQRGERLASAASTHGHRHRKRPSCRKTCATCWQPCPTICAACATGRSC